MHQNYSIFWTSMTPMHQNYSILLDLNASNASELFHILDLGGRRRRRRRRFPKNSGIWAEPWSNVPRNKISRAGNPSLRLSRKYGSTTTVITQIGFRQNSCVQILQLGFYRERHLANRIPLGRLSHKLDSMGKVIKQTQRSWGRHHRNWIARMKCIILGDLRRTCFPVLGSI